MKSALVVLLVCINLALLAALVVVNVSPANAQTERGANDYIMVTGKVEAGFDAVYVIDLKTRRLAAWRFDRTKKTLVAYKGRVLETDFNK
jgi:hypothetical protein